MRTGAAEVRGVSVRELASILAGLAVMTGLIAWMGLDLAVSGAFYDPAAGWFLSAAFPWAFLYEYGNIPGLFLGLAGIVLFLLTFTRYGGRCPWRREGLFLFLLLVLGPGLLVNAGLKDHWGRPRPCEIREFGGGEAYRPPWLPGDVGKGRSFPSGHAAVGFYVGAPFFVLRGRKREWAAAFLVLGVLYGILMGVGRIAQGGHFLSDVLWAWGAVHLTGILLAWGLRLPVATGAAGSAGGNRGA